MSECPQEWKAKGRTCQFPVRNGRGGFLECPEQLELVTEGICPQHPISSLPTLELSAQYFSSFGW